MAMDNDGAACLTLFSVLRMMSYTEGLPTCWFHPIKHSSVRGAVNKEQMLEPGV